MFIISHIMKACTCRKPVFLQSVSCISSLPVPDSCMAGDAYRCLHRAGTVWKIHYISCYTYWILINMEI